MIDLSIPKRFEPSWGVDVIDITIAMAHRFEIEPVVYVALCLHESGYEVGTGRIEERFFESRLLGKKREELSGYVPPPPGPPSLYDEKLWRASSWGPPHVLGETARMLGFAHDFLPALEADPAAALFYGAFYLRRLLGQDWNLKSEFTYYVPSLLRYNGGGDPDYPDKVQIRLEEAQEAIHDKRSCPSSEGSSS